MRTVPVPSRALLDPAGLPGDRAVCVTCRRPTVVCYCALVTKLTTRTRVVILQHPRERDMPVNTARIASLCLPDAEFHVGLHLGDTRAFSDPERPAALLYPGPGAIDVERHPPAGPVTLVVVDGTWSQAKKLVRLNPALSALPRYAFRPPSPSAYRIRREPRDDYVSTIEALVHVLGVLEGNRDRFVSMLAPFQAMVDAQVAFAERNVTRRRIPRVRPRVDPRTRLPRVFHERARDLVCVHAEANAWPYDAVERATCPEELVQWVACRTSTGETFEALVAPRQALCAKTPWHLGVERAALLDGVTPETLAERWAGFVRPTDVFCSWGSYSPRLFLAALPPGRPGALGDTRADLRLAARAYSNLAVGTMDDFRARLNLPAGEPRATGRAGARLATLSAIATHFAGPIDAHHA